MKVLYLNHTSRVSGAEHSLLTILTRPPREVEAWLAAPDGELADLAAAVGCRVVRVPEFDFSFRVGVAGLFAARRALRVAGQAIDGMLASHGFDLVHANSVRAGLMAAGPASRRRTPFIVHLRDALPSSALGCFVSFAAMHRASAVVANSAFTLATLRCVRRPAQALVVYNAVQPERFGPLAHDGAFRRQLGISPRAIVLAVVGQVTPWKAQDDAIRILKALTPQFEDLHLLIVGEPRFTSARTRHDNIAFMQELRSLTDALELGRAVHFLGHRDDIPAILRATDVVLVPSLEEPFGRTIIEAMAIGTPVVATSVGGPREIVVDGETGLLRPPRRPQAWATAIASLLDDAPKRSAMTARARAEVLTRFSPDRQAEDLGRLYRQLVR